MTAMSAFTFVLVLPLSCLALAKGSCIITSGGACPTNVLANAWQMTCARQAVLAAYGLHGEAAVLFEKNLVCIPMCSYFYDNLVLVHAASHLNWALNILLEMYVRQIIHKFCANSKEGWDPHSGSRDKYQRVLDQLKQLISSQPARSNVRERLRANLVAVWKLLFLFEESMFQLRPNMPDRLQTARHTRAFCKAHLTLQNDLTDREDRDLLSRRLLVATFGRVAPDEGHCLANRADYADWINCK
jgi:hypothetical protein